MCNFHNFDKICVIFRRIEMVYNGNTDRPYSERAGETEANMKNKQEQSIPMSMILTEELVQFGGMQLKYSLLVRESVPHNRFEIRIVKDDEVMTVRAGDRLEYALECYHKVVGGIVTPCTLEDVMRDFEYSRRKSRKSLYNRSIM